MLNEVIYGKMKKETDVLKSLERENQRLKIALAEKTLSHDALAILLEEAGIDQNALKKKHRVATIRRCSKEKQHSVSDLCKYFEISRLADGFADLSLLTDYYSRKVVGWNLSRSLGLEGSLQALHQALSVTAHPQGLVHHSDRGIQYCSAPYTSVLQQHGIRISMTEENHCYENALAERVNGILKNEYSLDATFGDYCQAYRACKEAINLYNTRRPHWALGFQTPEEVYRAA
jgi:transposase InsO family protein